MIFSGQTERDSKRGTSLLEVLITIVLLVAGVVTLMRVIGIGIFAEADVDNATTALYLAQEKMEEVKGAPSYVAIDGLASVRATLAGDFSGFEREVVVSVGDPKQVAISVYYDVKGSDQSIQLISLFTDYGY